MKKQYSYLFLVLGCILFLYACKKEKNIIRQPVTDDYIYEVNGQPVYQSSAEKNKQKTSEQYVSILYANLFQQSIPQDDLGDLAQIRTAIGDKQTADELIINGFVNNPEVNVPTDEEMRADIEQFVEDTYLRFFLRLPTAYERYELQEQIESDPELSPELIYTAFSLSNEYKFY